MMKTPREILLQKHRSAEPKLDALRAQVLKEELQPQLERASAGGVLCVSFNQLWTQLIMPSRRIWAGMAAVWVAVVVLNVISAEGNSHTYAGEPLSPATPELQMALQKQQKLLAELVNETPQESADKRRHIPRPRSDVTLTIRFA